MFTKAETVIIERGDPKDSITLLINRITDVKGVELSECTMRVNPVMAEMLKSRVEKAMDELDLSHRRLTVLFALLLLNSGYLCVQSIIEDRLRLKNQKKNENPPNP